MEVRHLIFISLLVSPFLNSNELNQNLVLLDLELRMLQDLLPVDVDRGQGALTDEQKLASDHEVVKALYRLASLEASNWQQYVATYAFVFKSLMDSPVFTEEKKQQNRALLQGPYNDGSFGNFIQNNLKKPPRQMTSEFLKAFFTTKSITVKNQRLGDVDVELFDAPSDLFVGKKNDLKWFFKKLFYDIDADNVWQSIFTGEKKFVENSDPIYKKFDQDTILKRILINILVAKREDPYNVSDEEKDQSDAVFYEIFLKAANDYARPEAYERLIDELDWLRINPLYLRFRNLLCTLDGDQVDCPQHALLTFLSAPEKVVKKFPSDEEITAFAAGRLKLSFAEHYYGNIADDLGDDNFANLKALIVTGLKQKYNE